MVNDCLMSACHLWLMSSVLPTNSITSFEKADDSSLRRLFGESYSSILPVVENIFLLKFISEPRWKLVYKRREFFLSSFTFTEHKN